MQIDLRFCALMWMTKNLKMFFIVFDSSNLTDQQLGTYCIFAISAQERIQL
jgi:hypothetical protein